MSRQQKTDNSRELVLSMLLKTLEEGNFSHLVLKEALSSHELPSKDRAFVLRLFHGVLEQVLYLDWILASYSSVKIKKMKPVIRNILRMSLYQMFFMDAVPDHAAINEAGRLAASHGLSGLKPFVNGVLRSVQRGGIKPGMPEHIRHSSPEWLYRLLTKERGKQAADAFLDAAKEAEEGVFARIQKSGISREEVLASLREEGCEAEALPEMKDAICIRNVGNLAGRKAFQEGWIFVQDRSSMQVGRQAAALCGSFPVRQIVDLCAAPGGKSLHLASLFPDARVLARDISEEKIRLIRENIARCQVENIRTEVYDARVRDASLALQADLVIADLPCSGIGVIGRKPDIKLRLQPEDIAELAALQREILTAAADYVKPGGCLLYSTCTISRSENEENTAWFTETFPYRLLEEHQWIPGRGQGDGFYLACLERTEL